MYSTKLNNWPKNIAQSFGPETFRYLSIIKKIGPSALNIEALKPQVKISRGRQEFPCYFYTNLRW